jgi:glycosyltransferase involved in cell wall biosynthesis
VNDLKNFAKELDLERHLIWADARDDMHAVYNALDVLALSSISEGFPNVVAEAMATSKPCAVTDVGDAAKIVGDCGVTVPPREPEALAEGLLALLNLPPAARAEIGARARDRVVRGFSIPALVRTTQGILERAARREQAKLSI